MKKIKRCIAIILSMVLGFSMSTVSFASERYNQNDNSKGTCSKEDVDLSNGGYTIIYEDGELVNFGDNSKGYVTSIGNVGNSKTRTIFYVLLVRNLKYNLVSISQLYDKGYKIKLEKDKCHIKDN